MGSCARSARSSNVRARSISSLALGIKPLPAKPSLQIMFEVLSHTSEHALLMRRIARNSCGLAAPGGAIDTPLGVHAKNSIFSRESNSTSTKFCRAREWPQAKSVGNKSLENLGGKKTKETPFFVMDWRSQPLSENPGDQTHQPELRYTIALTEIVALLRQITMCGLRKSDSIRE